MYSQIIITYENGTNETIKLPAVNPNNGKHNFAEIDGIIVKTLNMLSHKGYEIISSSHKTISTIEVTTYTIEKIE